MVQRLTPSPLVTWYGKPVLELAQQDFTQLVVKGVADVRGWVSGNTQELVVSGLKEPTLRLPQVDPYVQNLLRLAGRVPNLAVYSPGYEGAELEEVGALLVSTVILRVAQANAPTRAATSAEGEEAAKRHGWVRLEDAIAELVAYEEELVVLGAPVLQDDPALLEVWEKEKEDASFTAAAFAVRRRLVLVGEHELLFAQTAVTSERVARGQKLHEDAWGFYRGREGRLSPRKDLTLGRDEAFSLLLPRLERLQRVLRAAYLTDKAAREQIEGGHWKRLASLSKPRRKRSGEEQVPTGQSD